MKRKSLLFLLLVALFAPWAANAQNQSNSITVNEGTDTNNNVPINGFYCDMGNSSQFIIPAASLTSLQWGTLDKLTFYADNTVTKTFDGAVFEIYMAEVPYTVFESASFAEWTSLYKVYDGNLVWIGQEWEFTLDASNPFIYQGGNLLIGFHETSYATDFGNIYWLGVNQTTNTALHQNPYGNLSYVTFLPKVTIDYTPGVAPSCPQPTNLAVSNILAHNATITWTAGGNETSWEICLNDDEQNIITTNTTSYTFTNLDFGTHSMKVRANCGGGDYSTWAGPIVVYIGYCVPYYGNYSDCITNITLGSINNTTLGISPNGYGDYTNLSTTLEAGVPVSLSLTSGAGTGNHRAAVWIDFDDDLVFESSEKVGAYPNTIGASATVNIDLTIPIDAAVGTHRMRVVYEYNTSGTSIDPCTSSTSYGEAEDYTVVVINCPSPTDLNVTNLLSTNATLNWTSDANNFKVRYRTAACENEIFFEGFENGLPSTWTIVDSDGDEYCWVNETEYGVVAHTGKGCMLSTSEGGINGEGNPIFLNPDDWLITPQVQLQGTLKFWVRSAYSNQYDNYAVYVSTSTTNIDSFEMIGEKRGANSTKYTEILVDLSSYNGVNGYIAIRHYDSYEMWHLWLDDFGIYVPAEAGQWMPSTSGVSTVGNSYDIVNLASETKYEWQVQANCGIDGESNWSSIASFTTPSPCATPTDLNATDITAVSAKLNWTGAQENYNVSYGEVLFYEGFEGGVLPEGWASTRNGGENDTDWQVVNSETVFDYIFLEETVYPAHSGTKVAMAYGTINSWLITPQVTLDGILKFWMMVDGIDGTNNDAVIVHISTTGNVISDFTISVYPDIPLTPYKWTEITVDLRNYQGSLGYIAICNEPGLADFLFIDDVGIFDAQSTTTTASNVTVSNLTPMTNYFWQVQGLNCDGNGSFTEGSKHGFFSTPEGYSKEITGYGNNLGGWVFIASPVAESIAPTEVSGLVAATESYYDLYRLNPSNTMWENYKQTGDHYHFNLENGHGYLYASKEPKTLVFTAPFNEESPMTVDLSQGYHLVGNPFTVDATIDKSYYTLDETGSIIVATPVSGTTPIAPCTGVIVQSETANGSVTFTAVQQQNATNNNNNGNLHIGLTEQVATRGSASTKTLDNAIVSFNEGSLLGKFYFGTQSANIYIPQGSEEYAIAFSDKQGEMPLNFKATENGTYTITVNPENVKMAYLHLIDNLTGADIDLIATPSYSFEAKTTDYESRFKLVFASVCEDADGDNAFAFISNGNIIINGEGVLQVMDVLGRQLYAKELSTANCQLSTVNFPAGVYILRLINGDDVRTQKITIR